MSFKIDLYSYTARLPAFTVIILPCLKLLSNVTPNVNENSDVLENENFLLGIIYVANGGGFLVKLIRTIFGSTGATKNNFINTNKRTFLLSMQALENLFELGQALVSN